MADVRPRPCLQADRTDRSGALAALPLPTHASFGVARRLFWLDAAVNLGMPIPVLLYPGASGSRAVSTQRSHARRLTRARGRSARALAITFGAGWAAGPAVAGGESRRVRLTAIHPSARRSAAAKMARARRRRTSP